MSETPQKTPRPRVSILGTPNEEISSVSSRSYLLKDLAGEFEFFTVGVLYAVLPTPQDVIALTCQREQLDRELWPRSIIYPFVLYQGLDTGATVGTRRFTWGQQVYAIPREAWVSFRNTLAGTILTDKSRGWYARLGYSEVTVRDQHVEKLPVCKPADIFHKVTAFAVLSNFGTFSLQAADQTDMPLLVRAEADPTVIREARVWADATSLDSSTANKLVAEQDPLFRRR